MNLKPFRPLQSQWIASVSRAGSAAFAALLLSVASLPALALPGDLDATFGYFSGTGNGVFPVVTDNYVAVLGGAVLPDDRIVTGGVCEATLAGPTPTGKRFCLVVWGVSGDAPATYLHSSSNNRVENNALGAIAVQRDGKIVVAAPCRSTASETTVRHCAVRFNADFSPDTGFAAATENVAYPVDFTSSGSNNHYANDVAIQPDGKIIIAGQCAYSAGTVMCASRYLPDGSRDVSFRSGGIESTSGVLSAPFDRVKRIAVAADGKIYLAGDCKNSIGAASGVGFTEVRTACLARINGADGVLDSGFGSALGDRPAVFRPSSYGDEDVTDIVIQANGEMVIASSCGSSALGSPTISTTVPCLRRFAAPTAALTLLPGQLYTNATQSAGNPFTIANDGINSGAWLYEPPADGPRKLLKAKLLPDGKLLVLLRGATDSEHRVRLYHTNGAIDKAWNETGSNDFGFGIGQPSGAGTTNSRGVALDVQRSGRVIAMGMTTGAGAIREPRVVALKLGDVNTARACNLDIDNDGKILPTTDGLLLSRAAAGLVGNAVITGAIGVGALRNNWQKIRDYLVTQCGMVIP
jgi:uncharacterized delta-60 repeat protein